MRNLALACYALAALCMIAMAVASRRFVWRRVKVPPGWVFLSTATFLCAVGIAFDSI